MQLPPTWLGAGDRVSLPRRRMIADSRSWPCRRPITSLPSWSSSRSHLADVARSGRSATTVCTIDVSDDHATVLRTCESMKVIGRRSVARPRRTRHRGTGACCGGSTGRRIHRRRSCPRHLVADPDIVARLSPPLETMCQPWTTRRWIGPAWMAATRLPSTLDRRHWSARSAPQGQSQLAIAPAVVEDHRCASDPRWTQYCGQVIGLAPSVRGRRPQPCNPVPASLYPRQSPPGLCGIYGFRSRRRSDRPADNGDHRRNR